MVCTNITHIYNVVKAGDESLWLHTVTVSDSLLVLFMETFEHH